MPHEQKTDAELELLKAKGPKSEGQELSRERMKEELHSWCMNFIDTSRDWRKATYEVAWRRWQRNADSIYDPTLMAKKEGWQSKAFWPITPSHLESAAGQLYVTEAGTQPPIQVKARPNVPEEEDQGENIRDLIIREREKSDYGIQRNSVILDKATYGSGFSRQRWEEVTEERLVRTPKPEKPNMFDPQSIMRVMSGKPKITGFDESIQVVTTYRGVRYEALSIWDVFPDPKSLDIPGSPIAYRYDTTYGEILKGIEDGFFEKDMREKLKDLPSNEQTPEDKKVIESDRGIADSDITRTEHGSRIECFEVQARLPKKWVFLDGQEIDDPDKLISARIRVHKLGVVMVELSDKHDGEPDIVKDDYMPVQGQFYGRGIPEMLKDVQLVSNEEINQRIDAKTIHLTMSTMIGILEKAVVDPRDLENISLGGMLRLKNPSGMNDITKAFSKLYNGTIDSSAFIEPQEWERIAQERTSINRATLGTQNQANDTNKTLGGQQLNLQSSGRKFFYLGILSEINAQKKVAFNYYELIYTHYELDDFAEVLGQERMQTFQLLSPEDVIRDYKYSITGVYTTESQEQRQLRIRSLRADFAGAPWLDQIAFFDAEARGSELDPDDFKLPEADQQQIQAMAQQLAQQQLEEADETRKTEDKLSKVKSKEDAKEVAAASEVLDQEDAGNPDIGTLPGGVNGLA